MDLVFARGAAPAAPPGRGHRAGARTPRVRASARWAAVALGVGLAAAAPGCAHRQAAGAGERRQRFELPDGGALELGVPTGWKVTFGEAGESDSGGPAAPTVRLEGGQEEFLALVTPFQDSASGEEEEAAPPREPGGPPGADTAQALVELARRKALQTSVEREIALQELRGDGVHGFWFAATDRALAGKTPEKGEWRHLMQGAAAVGELIVAFTMLDNGPGPQREAVLAMMRGARHLPEGAAAAAPPGGGPEGKGGKLRFERDPAAATEPLAVAAPGHRWAVLVDLPGFQMMKPRANEDGAGLLVLGQEPESGLVASVSVRDAPGAVDGAACRERTLERLRAAAPDTKDLVRSDENGVARVRYRLDELRGKQVPQHHAHAFLARDGVCVDVHVSKVDPQPDDDARMSGILGTVRFGDTL
jgi:hypothetical protein